MPSAEMSLLLGWDLLRDPRLVPWRGLFLASSSCFSSREKALLAKLLVQWRAAVAFCRECLARSLAPKTWRGVVYGSDPYTGTVS